MTVSTAAATAPPPLTMGMDRAALEQATKSLNGGGALVWKEVPPQLEDVFIHFMSKSAQAPARAA